MGLHWLPAKVIQSLLNYFGKDNKQMNNYSFQKEQQMTDNWEKLISRIILLKYANVSPLTKYYK